ncbi:MAG: DMT family transporter, partial [Candidatus Nanopelagicales bacterium]|nr:DMT family transporter [Candidatus Nanopelagicales bacterium]
RSVSSPASRSASRTSTPSSPWPCSASAATAQHYPAETDPRVCQESLFIGLYLVGLGVAPDDSGVWVAVFSRWWSSLGMVAVGLVVLVRHGSASWRPYPWLAVIAVGALDGSANGMFQLAAQGGELIVVAVIGSLYPAATLLLAHWFLHERMSRIQWSGVVLALGAAAALAI